MQAPKSYLPFDIIKVSIITRLMCLFHSLLHQLKINTQETTLAPNFHRKFIHQSKKRTDMGTMMAKGIKAACNLSSGYHNPLLGITWRKSCETFRKPWAVDWQSQCPLSWPPVGNFLSAPSTIPLPSILIFPLHNLFPPALCPFLVYRTYLLGNGNRGGSLGVSHWPPPSGLQPRALAVILFDCLPFPPKPTIPFTFLLEVALRR